MPTPFVFIENYLGLAGNTAFGVFNYTTNQYELGDSDSYRPDQINDLGDAHYLGAFELEEILGKYYKEE